MNKTTHSNNKKTIKIYKVKITKQYIDMRMEDYDCTCYIFTNKDKALEFSYNKALEYYKKNCEDDDYVVKFRESGQYKKYNEDYTYFVDFLSEVEESTLDFNNDIISVTEFNGCN